MAKLTRYLQKIFANDSNRVGVFGTGVNKETSKNVETLQSADYENGWSAAIVTNKNYPIWQERDGVDYGLSYQIKYLDQMGLAEWIATETYYTTSYCQYNGMLYRSKIDDNINHTPLGFSDDYWQCLGRNFLNTQQVTNCLLEVPNNIKLELNNGAFVLKAGSKVIVPNGFEADGVTPKFDEVIIESDISNSTTSLSSTPRMVAINPDGQTVYAMRNDRVVSGATDSITGYSHWWYDTTNNLVKRISASNVLEGYASFPIGFGSLASSGTAGWLSINQIFNGFGYIGSVIWADKGIKGLIPNGRNADGSLNNTEFTTDKVITTNFSSSVDGYYSYLLSNNYALTTKYLQYKIQENLNYNTVTGVYYTHCACGSFTLSSGAITGATFDGALNINSMCDGRWVHSSLTLANNVTYPTSTDTVYDLSSYLPADGYNYEVLLDGGVTTGTTSGNTITLGIQSAVIPTAIAICRARTRTSSSVLGGGNAIIPIGANRGLTVTSDSGSAGVYSLVLKGYRRIGTNS